MIEWSALRVDRDRLVSRLDELAHVGEVRGPGGEWGCSRLALTDADRLGRDLVVGWMRDLGLEVAIDAIGNVFATMQGTEPALPPVMTGSHIDTVRSAGRFDGNLGVLAGLEVVETLRANGVVPRRSVVVAFFTGEEGVRFPPDMLGSLVHVGGLDLESALDVIAVDDGARLGDELVRIGYAGSLPCPTSTVPDSFVELHVEQGPVLEAAGVTIGVVESVQGISWTELSITGRSSHAGTTPMGLRRDAVHAAAVITTFVRDLARRLGASQVATVGRLDVRPSLVNVVASEVTMTVDLRNTDDRVLTDAERRLAALCDEVARDEGVTIDRRSLARFEPVDFDAEMIALVEQTAQRLGHTTMRLASGAGHDAQMLARICPSAMVFVPSRDGLSHNIAEYTEPDHVRAGADVLLQAVLSRAMAGPDVAT